MTSMCSCFFVFNKWETSPVALWLLTHLYGGTGHTGTSHTEQSGHSFCQRRGNGSLSQERRGNGGCCAIARNLESGQSAVTLQDAHNRLEKYMQTSTHTCKQIKTCWGSRVPESTVVIKTDALCPLPPPEVQTILTCSVLQCHSIAKIKHGPGNVLSFKGLVCNI